MVDHQAVNHGAKEYVWFCQLLRNWETSERTLGKAGRGGLEAHKRLQPGVHRGACHVGPRKILDLHVRHGNGSTSPAAWHTTLKRLVQLLHAITTLLLQLQLQQQKLQARSRYIRNAMEKYQQVQLEAYACRHSSAGPDVSPSAYRIWTG